jgi:hypothetical protein
MNAMVLIPPFTWYAKLNRPTTHWNPFFLFAIVPHKEENYKQNNAGANAAQKNIITYRVHDL